MFDGVVLLCGLADPRRAIAALQAEGFETEVAGTADAVSRRLDDHYGNVTVVLDARIADDDLLARLQRDGAPPSVFLIGVTASAAAITLSPNVSFLADSASPGEICAAVVAAQPQAGVMVGDFSDRDAQRLNSLGREVERIARTLSDLATATQTLPERPAVAPADVRALIRRRRDRERFFPADLFSDPAWDMLLDLTAARLERRLVSVSSLCIAAAVPTSTALRWIRNLCDIGLFERNIDPDDLRRGLISLSDTTAERMVAYLAGARGAVMA